MIAQKRSRRNRGDLTVPQKKSSNQRKSKSLRVLGIETSCDETAVAIVEIRDHVPRVRLNLVSSQIPLHQKYGGVVPEVAARSHVPEMISLLTRALKKNALNTFDAIAVTQGPGLPTALQVGLETARALACVSGKPIIGINHLEGHLASAWLNPANRQHWDFPLLALTASGGHTELVLIKDYCDYRIVGQTRDDAAGEAFDKSAKLLGLPYPGGPAIAKLALDGDPLAYDLPRPMIQDATLDMSFSGLKTAVRVLFEKVSVIPAKTGIQPRRSELDYQTKCDLAASIQQAIIDVLVEKTMRAAKKYRAKGVVLVGGVSANRELRRHMDERVKKELRIPLLLSDLSYVTDNAAMIAAAGAWRLKKGERHDWRKMETKPEWEL